MTLRAACAAALLACSSCAHTPAPPAQAAGPDPAASLAADRGLAADPPAARQSWPARPPAVQRASRSYRRPRTLGQTRVSATAYCLTGRMADGRRVYDGAAAANDWPLGTRLLVVELGRVLTVADRIGSGTQLDLAMPGRCADAFRFGRRVLTVEVVG